MYNVTGGWTKIASQMADITPGPAAALAATLEADWPAPRAGETLPPLWHWVYTIPTPRTSELSEDGRKRGLPSPVPQTWAGVRVHFERALRFGETASWTTHAGVARRATDGRSSEHLTVLRHEVRTDEELVLTEREEWVHRSGPISRSMQMLPPADPIWQQDVYPNEVLLFRYSALTFNSHRIHYDRRFAIETEGFRGLVVQPQLSATLLLELLRRNLPSARVKEFSCRLVQPLFDTAPFAVCGRTEDDGTTVRLWAKNAQGGLALSATAIVSYS